MEYQTTGWLSSKLKQLEAENTRLKEELAKWTRVFGHLGTADECGNEWIALKEELAAAQTDAARYRWLREACGYVQDGSSTSVTISQDDATHEWVVRVGDVGSRHWWHGKSLGEAINAAIKEVGHEQVPRSV